eukprot:5801558-Prymnesium_polylepis.1
MCPSTSTAIFMFFMSEAFEGPGEDGLTVMTHDRSIETESELYRTFIPYREASQRGGARGAHQGLEFSLGEGLGHAPSDAPRLPGVALAARARRLNPGRRLAKRKGRRRHVKGCFAFQATSPRQWAWRFPHTVVRAFRVVGAGPIQL